MRLDIFLPVLRKPRKGTEPRPDGWLPRLAKCLLPGTLFADKATGEAGLARRVLKRIGPTMLSSPVRRVVQGVCFAVFLVLFFYVCWPYTAESSPSLISDGWVTVDQDLQTVRLVIAKSGRHGDFAQPGGEIHLVDAEMPTATDGYVAPFRVAELDNGRLTLSPAGELTDEAIDRLIEASGNWSLHRSHPWPAHYTDDLQSKQFLPGEFFLAIDPLVSISTAIAARSWVWSLTWAAVMLLVCNCNQCVEICPFDAIKPDFTTRTTDCTLCQSCGGVCPTHAIKFVDRWNTVELKAVDDPPTGETPLGRRGFLSLAAGSTAALVGGGAAALGIRALVADGVRPAVRPPGSVPEPSFLDLCIRCAECFKVCPNNVLQPMGFEHGLDGLWTPRVVADWAGCEASCNACGQVCPTGAIRAIPLEEKRVARMGLAIVNQRTCLPLAGREACQLCVDECNSAGYRAIEQMRVGTQVDEDGKPIEGSGFLAPVVLADKCVGCGLCQTRCYAVNVKTHGLLGTSAIIVEAGDDREDRLIRGSYRELRKRETDQREKAETKRRDQTGDGGYYVPGVHEPEDPFGGGPSGIDSTNADPFGLPLAPDPPSER